MVIGAINGFSNGSWIIGPKLNGPCERNVALITMEHSFTSYNRQRVKLARARSGLLRFLRRRNTEKC